MKPAWLAHPVLSALLAAAWLLLQQSLALPQIITAGVLALLIPRLMHGFLGPTTRPRAPLVALRLVFTVARIVLWPWSNPQPAWVTLPLDVQHPNAMTLLASIITMTPGTVSAVVDESRRCILVHVLDCADPAAVVADIKARYEAPLKEIFG